MVRRLKIYFIHSTKFDYNNLLYKQVLSSNVCLAHDLWLPMTDTYKSKYAKDLINKADLIIAVIDAPSFGLKLELKWAKKVDKPIIYLSFNNVIPASLKKYVSNLEITDENKSMMQIIDDFITKYANISEEEQKDPTIILGEL